MSKAIDRPEIKLDDRNWLEAQKYIGKDIQKRGQDPLVLPGGVVISGTPWRGFQHSVNVKGYVMQQPEKVIKDPNPRAAYCWRPRDDPKHSTEGLVRTGKIAPVEFDRIIENAPGVEELYSYAGVKDENGEDVVVGFVACGDYQLFEVAPETAYEWYGQPVDATFAQIGGLKGHFNANAAEDAERRGWEHKGSDITISDRQSVVDEKRHPKH